MKVDALDKQILRLLAQNGRLPSSEIARTVAASERTVTNRVNSLIESGIISIIGVINEELFGYDVTADIYCQVETARQEEVAQAIAALPEVRYAAISFGEYDVVGQVVSQSPTALHQFIAQKLAKIPGVQRVTTVVIPVILKDIQEWLPPELNLDEKGTEQ
jgi:DNA-binding Lrp family transcriptional regulator